MANVLNDWAWRPDDKVEAALLRGATKFRATVKGAAADADRLPQVLRRAPTEGSGAAERSREAVAAYLARLPALRGENMLTLEEYEDMAKKRRGGDVDDKGGVQANQDDGGPVREAVRGGGRGARKVRGADPGVGTEDGTEGRRGEVAGGDVVAAGPAAGRDGAGADGGWVAVVHVDLDRTRAVGRLPDMPLARAYAGTLPEDWSVVAVNAESDIRHLRGREATALLLQFGYDGDVEELDEDAKLAAVRGYLSLFDRVKHDDETFDLRAGETYGPVPALPAKRPDGAKGRERKPAAGPREKKDGKPKGKRASAPAAKRNGDGLGPEGTPARFIREAWIAGKTSEAIVAACAKAFPKNPIDKGYANWYRRDMIKKGLLKEDKTQAA